MAKRGRRRKNGARTPSGQLSRAKQPKPVTFDKGTERAQAMRTLYGTDGCDAIGRAYRAGLLGQGQDAKAMLDTARRVSFAYWAAYEVGPFASAIADKVSGSIGREPPEKAREREEWLAGCLTLVNRLGRTQRRFFDALVVDIHPDYGPTWLDSLLYAHRAPRVAIEPADANALDMALEALAMLAGVEKPHVARLKAA